MFCYFNSNLDQINQIRTRFEGWVQVWTLAGQWTFGTVGPFNGIDIEVSTLISRINHILIDIKRGANFPSEQVFNFQLKYFENDLNFYIRNTCIQIRDFVASILLNQDFVFLQSPVTPYVSPTQSPPTSSSDESDPERESPAPSSSGYCSKE